MTRDICIGKDEKDAQNIVKAPYERRMHMQSGWGQPGGRYDLPFEQLKEERVILGSPRQCADEIVSQHKEFGAEFMAFRVYTPGMEPSRGLDMVEQLGKDVLPLVRQEVGAKSLFA